MTVDKNSKTFGLHPKKPGVVGATSGTIVDPPMLYTLVSYLLWMFNFLLDFSKKAKKLFLNSGIVHRISYLLFKF